MNHDPDNAASPSPQDALGKVREIRRRLLSEIHKVIIGQDAIIEELLIAIVCRGHALIVGVPGLGKTLMVSTLARVLDLSFNRIQFTPDLMPSDITGSEILDIDPDTGRKQMMFLKGPVFHHIILADEINRTPPKTQAALLESMQERHVTIGGVRHDLPTPFFVLATQNPIEQEGTYPLPEAQLDRFMFMIHINYPTYSEETEIIKSTTASLDSDVRKMLGVPEILKLQKLVRRIPVSDHIVDYAIRLTRATRHADPLAPDYIKNWLSWGAGPRAGQALIMAAKARAALDGRPTPSIDDVKRSALPVIRHRIFPNFNAESDGVTADDIIRKLIADTPEKAVPSA